ncbi:MAG TPA: hypothetical protein QF695_04820 [Arenicellales bacterium]|jgi:hypothetical protein|nr:hypothetical protein [Arenicellales bacterium]HJL51944.1 hypothetical protein [Arenicellales bacterium]
MSETTIFNPWKDDELASKCYPAGTKNEATAMCLISRTNADRSTASTEVEEGGS